MATPRTPSVSPRRPRITALGAVVFLLGLLALVAPIRAEVPASRVGGLLALAALIESIHALRRSTPAARKQATAGAAISMVIAIVLISAPYVVGEALRVAVALWFGLDAI